MRIPLHVHPAGITPDDGNSRVSTCSTVEVALTRTSDGSLQLDYSLPSTVVLPPPARADGPSRCDGLWQRTCVELFIADADSSAYREFNFAPSGDWAAYDFSDYRQRTEGLPEVPVPRVEFHHHRISVNLPGAAMPAFLSPVLGLTAVLETAAGQLAYLALHHATERPDFHHRDSFILPLTSLPLP